MALRYAGLTFLRFLLWCWRWCLCRSTSFLILGFFLFLFNLTEDQACIGMEIIELVRKLIDNGVARQVESLQRSVFCNRHHEEDKKCGWHIYLLNVEIFQAEITVDKLAQLHEAICLEPHIGK